MPSQGKCYERPGPDILMNPHRPSSTPKCCLRRRRRRRLLSSNSSPSHMPTSMAENLVYRFRFAMRLTFLRSLSASPSSNKKTFPAADHRKKLSSSDSSSSKKQLSSCPSSTATAANRKKPSSNLTKTKTSSADHGETPSNSSSESWLYIANSIFKTLSSRKVSPPMNYGAPPMPTQEGEQYLKYLIDGRKVFQFFHIRDIMQWENPDALPRLAYYEMLLWIRVRNDVKIRELCQSAVGDAADNNAEFKEQLLLALCESDYEEDFLMLLRNIDITAIKPFEHLECIFRALGKFLLETYAENFLLSLKRSGIADANISNFINEYATNTPNSKWPELVADVIDKFLTLHDKLEVLPNYDNLIKYSLHVFKMREAFDLVDKALDSGAAISLEVFDLILDACAAPYELDPELAMFYKGSFVGDIDKSSLSSKLRYIALNISSSLSAEQTKETFRKMILLCFLMGDHDGIGKLIYDLKEMDKGWRWTRDGLIF